jgi:hypothetical protein
MLAVKTLLPAFTRDSNSEDIFWRPLHTPFAATVISVMIASADDG